MNIEPLQEKHIPHCVELLMATYNREPWCDNWTKETGKDYLYEFFTHRRFVGFAALENGTVIGALFGRVKTYYLGEEFYVEELFVSPHKQQKGCGKALLQRVEEYIHGKNFCAIVLLTERFTPAKQFYSNNGFKTLDNMRLLYKPQ